MNGNEFAKRSHSNNGIYSYVVLWKKKFHINFMYLASITLFQFPTKKNNMCMKSIYIFLQRSKYGEKKIQMKPQKHGNC